MTEEENLQAASIRYIRMQYPSALSFHVANERVTTPARGAKLKRLGVLAGVADIIVLHPNCEFHGLLIELKSKKGVLSESQKTFLSKAHHRMYRTAVCRTIDEVISVVDEYMSA